MSPQFCENCGKPVLVLIDELMGKETICSGCEKITVTHYGYVQDSLDGVYEGAD